MPDLGPYAVETSNPLRGFAEDIMPDLGPYAVEVLSAYAVTLTLLIAVILQSWHRFQSARKRLEKVETRHG